MRILPFQVTYHLPTAYHVQDAASFLGPIRRARVIGHCWRLHTRSHFLADFDQWPGACQICFNNFVPLYVAIFIRSFSFPISSMASSRSFEL